jgi:hypothetical protein
MLGMLIGVGKRMVQLRIGQAPGVMGFREREKGCLAPGEIEQARPTAAQTAFCTLPPFRQRVQT